MTVNPGGSDISPKTAAPTWRQWLGLERNIVVMLASLLILGMGEELWVRYVPRYLEVLGASTAVIALYGTLKDLLDAVYQYPGGWLADRLGRRAALLLFTLTAIVGYILYLAGPDWLWVMAGTLFVMAWSSLTLPAIFAIIGDNLPKQQRATGFGVQSILKRVPIVIAPPLGGWLIGRFGLLSGVRLGLVVTIVLAFVAIFVVWRYYQEKEAPPPDASNFWTIWRQMDTNLKRLLVADILARWAEGLVKVLIILYVVNILRASDQQFGWLTSVQMMAAILVYIPIAKLSDRMNRKPFVLLTFALFALFPLVLVRANGLLWLILAFAIAGLREIGEPARKALIVDLSHVASRGRAVGTYYLVRGLAVFPASLVGGWLWTRSPQLPFYVAFGVGVASFLAYALWGPSEAKESTT
jgi:MFS family permease